MPCRLFRDEYSLTKKDGYIDWKNINRIFSLHEYSKDHYICQKAMLDRSRAIMIDNALCLQDDAGVQYWKNV